MAYYDQIERSDDRAYYSRRAVEEAARAEKAVLPAAKRAHTRLADIFTRKAAVPPGDSGEPLGLGPIQVFDTLWVRPS